MVRGVKQGTEGKQHSFVDLLIQGAWMNGHDGSDTIPGVGRGGEREIKIRYGTYLPGVCRPSKGKSEQLTLRQGTKTTHGSGRENSEKGQMPSSWRSLEGLHGGGGWLCTALDGREGVEQSMSPGTVSRSPKCSWGKITGLVQLKSRKTESGDRNKAGKDPQGPACRRPWMRGLEKETVAWE